MKSALGALFATATVLLSSAQAEDCVTHYMPIEETANFIRSDTHMLLNNCSVRVFGNHCWESDRAACNCFQGSVCGFGPIVPGGKSMISGPGRNIEGAKLRLSYCNYDDWVQGTCKAQPRTDTGLLSATPASATGDARPTTPREARSATPSSGADAMFSNELQKTPDQLRREADARREFENRSIEAATEEDAARAAAVGTALEVIRAVGTAAAERRPAASGSSTPAPASQGGTAGAGWRPDYSRSHPTPNTGGLSGQGGSSQSQGGWCCPGDSRLPCVWRVPGCAQ